MLSSITTSPSTWAHVSPGTREYLPARPLSRSTLPDKSSPPAPDPCRRHGVPCIDSFLCHRESRRAELEQLGYGLSDHCPQLFVWHSTAGQPYFGCLGADDRASGENQFRGPLLPHQGSQSRARHWRITTQ